MANLSLQTRVGKLKLVCVKDTTTVVKHVGKLLARIETSSICRQQFASVFADCFCDVHTHQLEFANSSLPCEGRFRISYIYRAVFKLLSKAITRLQLLCLVIGLKI